MFHWLIGSLILISVMGQEEELYNFEVDESIFVKCIKDYLLNCDDPYYREVGNAEDIATFAANRFCGKTKTWKDLVATSNQFFYYLKNKHSYLFKNYHIHEPLRLSIREALIHCDYYQTGKFEVAPAFTNEPYEIGIVLDYILVDWTESLHRMILTRNGRALLRRYAEDAGVRLARALDSVMNHAYFRYLLRSYWIIRAQNFFHGSEKRISYMRYRYTLENPFPHTYDNHTNMLRRRVRPLSERNTLVSKKNYDELMHIHATCRSDHVDNDLFSVYERNGGVTTAQYYIETHIDQFYRILFFFMELQIRGISTDEEDKYDGMLPYEIVSHQLQAMLYSNYAYRNYLVNLRLRLERAVTNNSQFQIVPSQFLSSARIIEEDLISLFSLWIQKNSLYNSTVTAFNFTSTTPKYEQPKRKGSVLSNDKGKHFCKKPKISSSDVEQQKIQKDRQYGYITYNGDPISKTNCSVEELITFMMTDSRLQILLSKLDYGAKILN